MDVALHETAQAAGQAAAALGGRILAETIARQGAASIVLATGASQFAMLDALCADPGIDWSRVEIFHLDEYIGLPADHPASFRRYLNERVLDRLPALRAFHGIVGDAPDTAAEVARLNALMQDRTIDLVFAGVGENAHLAFNDPPADFETQVPFEVVTLDEACRRQQFGEGWFPSLEAVPAIAITMTIRQILRGAQLILTVTDERKALAVRDTLEGPLTPLCPASILREHPACHLFLDRAAASLLAAPG